MEASLSFETNKIWVGNMPRGDLANRIPKGEAHRTTPYGVAFRIVDSVFFAIYDRAPSSDNVWMLDERSDDRWQRTSGVGSAGYEPVNGSEEEDYFIITDLRAWSSLTLPISQKKTTLHWKWYTENGLVHRVVLWCPDFRY